MKLYFAPETCSLSPHIVLCELDLPFELVRVDNRTKRTADGADFLAINPKGYVAALQLDDGAVLTEGPAIVQYLSDLKPQAGLAPPNGTLARARLQEWLNFISSEIHGTSHPLFSAAMPDAVKALFRDKLCRRLELVAAALGKQDYLMAEGFGVADAYLFTVLRWMKGFAIDVGQWPALAAFMARISERPAVKAALAAEAAAPSP